LYLRWSRLSDWTLAIVGKQAFYYALIRSYALNSYPIVVINT